MVAWVPAAWVPAACRKMRRRPLLSGGLLPAFAWLNPAWLSPALAQNAPGGGAGPALPPAPGPQAPNPQAPKLDDTVAGGFNRIVIARWGDSVLPGAPAFNPNGPTRQAADTQFPYDAVIAGLVPPPPAQDGIPRLVAVLATPDVPARMVFPGGVDNPDIAGRMQGVTVMNLQFMGGRWVTVDGGYQCRRLHDGTLCQISGPAAAAIGNTVQGILAPQGGCATAWGTVLLAEGDPAPWLKRLAGVAPALAAPAAAPRFAWVTELDPLDPLSIPVKRTALGRFPRAGIAAGRTGDGRPVVFMSQNAPDGFLFRFVASGTGDSALDSGTLAVAQIHENNIRWVNLGSDVASLVGAPAAADAAQGSPFDGPGGLAIAGDGSNTLYLACRGNPARTMGSTNALNPRVGDDNGHILVFAPPNGDLAASSFTGDLAIVAGNPARAPFTQYTDGSDCWFKNPRTLALDPLGQLWIGTDQRGRISGTADGYFIMQTGGPSKYLVNEAYLAPIGAAAGGAAFDAASRTAFGMVRHPGATPQASFSAPATRWPTLRPDMPPQSTVIGLVGQG